MVGLRGGGGGGGGVGAGRVFWGEGSLTGWTDADDLSCLLSNFAWSFMTLHRVLVEFRPEFLNPRHWFDTGGVDIGLTLVMQTQV